MTNETQTTFTASDGARIFYTHNHNRITGIYALDVFGRFARVTDSDKREAQQHFENHAK